MTKATHRRESLLGLAYSFRPLVHGHHGGKHGSRQAGTVLDQYMRTHVLRRDQEEKRRMEEKERDYK